MAIYNDIITVGVNPARGVFCIPADLANMMKKLAKLAVGKIFLRNREKFLATSGKFVTI
jgi:hypothetical protein